MTIAIRFQGGLGNQMFQYALGRRLADERGERLILEQSYYLKAKHCKFALDKFQIRFDIADERDANTQFQLIQEKSLAYDPGIFELKGDLMLDGYWQNPGYIDHPKSLRDDFRPKVDIDPNLLPLRQLIKENNSVSVHVRGGDYKGWYQFDRATPDYYNKAFEKIAQEVEKPLFFVFTNDKEYAEWILYDVQKKYQIILVSGEDWEELCLMQMCKHHIIVNSSFSWWGSYLSDNPGKKIIALSPWFNDNGNTKEHLEINPYTSDMTIIEV